MDRRLPPNALPERPTSPFREATEILSSPLPNSPTTAMFPPFPIVATSSSPVYFVRAHPETTEEIVKRHLVLSSSQGDNDVMERAASPFRLQGGDVTHDVYRWANHTNHQPRQRAQSVPRTYSSTGELNVANLRAPGGMRRHHVQSRQPQNSNVLTKNFIDFLTLYGHFAGDFYPESDSDSEDEEVERGIPETQPLIQPSTGTASVGKIFFLLIKSFVGTGVLFLPRSFYNGGLAFSVVILCIVAFLCLHCMLVLIECRQVIPGSFGDIGEALYGRRAKVAVLSSIALSQIGFSCAYTIFVATTLRDLILLVSDCQMMIPMSFLIYLQLVVYTPLAMIRKIKHLSSTALIADVFIVIGLAYLFYYDFYIISTVGAQPVHHFNLASFSLFLGTAIFTFEGIGLVIPIVESMKEPERFPSVLSWTMLLMVTVFCSVGTLSYLAFGDKVETVVLLNLPSNSVMVVIIQLLYTLAILFSVPLQMFPAIGILENLFFEPGAGKTSMMVKWEKNLLRFGVALVVAIVADLGSDNLDRFVSLIGSFACIPLSFIYPSLFHLKGVATTLRQKAVDVGMIAFGLLMMLYVTIVTIQGWGDASVPHNRCS